MTADKLVYIPGAGDTEFSNGSYPLSGLLKNNSLLIKVQDGEAIKLTSDITDLDFFDYDPVCVTNTWTKPKTWSQWATTANETYELYNEHDNATCSVNVVLNAVAP